MLRTTDCGLLNFFVAYGLWADLHIKMSHQENDESMDGVEMTGIATDIPPLSEQEKRILEVYDKLEELQVEIALLKAQGVISSEGPSLHTDLRKHVS